MRLTPLYVFDDPAEFHRRHSNGVLQEFNNESREITHFNRRQTQFKAWILASLYRGKASEYWVFLVRPSEQADYLFPREGESCDITLWQKSGKDKRWDKSWEAERIENPAATFGIPEGPAHRLPAFKVKVPNNVPDDILRAMEDDPDQVGYYAPSRLTGRYAFGDKKAYKVTMVLRMSSATKDAELGAIDKLYHNPDGILTAKQIAAFNYLLNFKHVPFTVNMFNHFPHLRDPINNPGGMPPKVITILKGFNEHQRTAYKEVLRNIPCGVCILPGGPGAGKTHWNLVLTAAIQSKSIIHHGPDNSSNRTAKVLYILDINKPLDDTCNKIVRLYKSLNLKRHAVRLHGWHYGRNRETPDFSNKFMFMARMNRYRRHNFKEGCLAPSLDELAWEFYETKKTTQFREIHDLMTQTNHGEKDDNPGYLKDLVHQLYQSVLTQVDFIATTPVPAATGFHGLFKPDIVIFDESPHAREASTMVAIAQYNPIAWIFSGVKCLDISWCTWESLLTWDCRITAKLVLSLPRTMFVTILGPLKCWCR